MNVENKRCNGHEEKERNTHPRTRILVARTFGNDDFLDLFSGYIADKLRHNESDSSAGKDDVLPMNLFDNQTLAY